MKETIRNIISVLIQSEKKKVIQLIFLDVAVSFLDIAFLAVLLYVIQFYTEKISLASSVYFPSTIFRQYPLLPILTFFILFSAKNFFSFRVLRMQIKFGYNVASRLSGRNLFRFLHGNYNDYVNTDSSVNIYKISQQPIEFGHYVLAGFQQMISQGVIILLTITAVLIYNPILFLSLLVLMTPAIVIAAILMKRKLSGIRRIVKPLSAKATQNLTESLSAFIESNVYQSKAFFSNRYHDAQSKFNNVLSEQFIMQNMPSRLIEIFAILGLVVLISVNSFTANSMSIITLGAFIAAAYKIIPGIVKILNSTGQIKTYGFVIENLNQNDFIRPEKTNQNIPSIQSIAFQNVFFRYQNVAVLNNFSATISKGDFIGLSGISGKGKTTIVNLLLGFLRPDRGSILLNGIYTGSAGRRQLWKSISYVKQQTLLIYDSIEKNITLNDNDCDFQKLEEVIRITGLTDLVDNHVDGYHQFITENGRNLSGGQRQRIAIARALYKESELIILDEPFSELDWLSEERLLNHLSLLASAGKIIILITHHKESLSFCNKIISLDEERPAGFVDFDARFS